MAPKGLKACRKFCYRSVRNPGTGSNWQKSYHDTASNATGDEPTIGDYETFDLQGTYSGIKHLKFTLGVKNVFDRDPPHTNVGGQAQFQTGYDATYADPRCRFYDGSLTYSFL